MSDQPTYCPLCGTREPHECESKPVPKKEAPKPTPMGMPERKTLGTYTFTLDEPSSADKARIALDWNDLET